MAGMVSACNAVVWEAELVCVCEQDDDSFIDRRTSMKRRCKGSRSGGKTGSKGEFHGAVVSVAMR